MRSSELSFLSSAQKLTLSSYEQLRKSSIFGSEIIGRVAAGILLSPAAALDIGMHSILMPASFIYCIGASIYKKKGDFSLAVEHLQRIRNSVSPLFFGSSFGILHPLAGLALSEQADKHSVIGMLSSNIERELTTACSPLDSLSIVENLAMNHQYALSGTSSEKKQIYSKEHLEILGEIKDLEGSLELLQAQEYVHSIGNITHFAMGKLLGSIESSSLKPTHQQILKRASGLLMPILSGIDLTITLLAETFFIATGITRMISGRGPIYTEITSNPLMHLSFMLQGALKFASAVFAAPIWFISPNESLKASSLPVKLFFNYQMERMLSQIESKIKSLDDKKRLIVPVLYQVPTSSKFSMPFNGLHQTYLIIEKSADSFNLYWVNRPNISIKRNLTEKEALSQLRSMVMKRFPDMLSQPGVEKKREYNEPEFTGSESFAKIESQGNKTNCVVSNLFGMFSALDKIKGEKEEITKLREKATRKALIQEYGFYQNEFFLSTYESDRYCLTDTWPLIEEVSDSFI